MERDIDHIIERLKIEIPGVGVTQLKVAHQGVDDDGIWFIKTPQKTGEVQIESSHGSCPFFIEADFNAERFCGKSVDEVIQIVKRLFT